MAKLRQKIQNLLQNGKIQSKNAENIRVDSASTKELEPAAAGTSDDSSLLYGLLNDFFQKKTTRIQSDTKKHELYSFLDNWFRSR